MSDLYALPPLPSSGVAFGTTGSGQFSSGALSGDLSQMAAGSVPGLPGDDSSSSPPLSSFSTLLSGLTGNLTGATTAASSGSGTSANAGGSSTSSGSSGLLSLTSDSLIGRVLFFLLGLIFVAGAIYTYKK